MPSVKSSKLHVAAQRTASPGGHDRCGHGRCGRRGGWHHLERFTEAKRREVLPRVRVVRMNIVRCAALRCAAYRATSSQGNTQGRRALAHIAACAAKYSVLSALKALRVTTVVLGILGLPKHSGTVLHAAVIDTGEARLTLPLLGVASRRHRRTSAAPADSQRVRSETTSSSPANPTWLIPHGASHLPPLCKSQRLP